MPQIKIFPSYPGCHKVRSTLADFFQSINKGRMWWYNILGDNKGSISHILRLDTINAGSVLITNCFVSLKRENSEPILTLKITEWRKFIDYFGLSIEANPHRVVKKNIYFVHICYIPRPSSIKIHVSRHHMEE